MANMMQQALMDQILNTASKRVGHGQVQGQPAQRLPSNASMTSMKLGDVRNMEDARQLARQIVQSNGLDISSLSGDNPKLKQVLEELRTASNPNSQAGGVAEGFGAPVPQLTNSMSHVPPPPQPAQLPAAMSGFGTLEAPLPFEDSLPETPTLMNALREGHKASQRDDLPGVLTAVQSLVKEKGTPGLPVADYATPQKVSAVPQQQHLYPAGAQQQVHQYFQQHGPPNPAAPTPPLMPAQPVGTPRAGAQQTSPMPPAPVQPAAVGLPSDGAAGADGLQNQLQQQQQQLSLLSQLQQQLMSQQVKQAGVQMGGVPYPSPGVPNATDPHVSPSRMRAGLLPPVNQAVAAEVFRTVPDVVPSHLAAEAECAYRERLAAKAVPSPLAVGGGFSPLASRPMWGGGGGFPAPGGEQAFSSPAPPAAPPAAAAAAAADMQQFHSIGASTMVSESPEELEAREQAHRIMVDFIAQKNLTNLLTEKLAEKTNEADSLRARLATGEGKESFHQMSETLSTYEKELGTERARTLSLEHEIHKLRASFEEAGLPLPKARTEYETEITDLKRKIEMQDQMIQEIQRNSERQRNELHLETEGRLALAANQSNDTLLREIDMLKTKLREKRNVNQELQDMLKLHLRYNSEIRAKSLLHQPQWVHPLLKEPQPSVQEFSNPTERVEL